MKWTFAKAFTIGALLQVGVALPASPDKLKVVKTTKHGSQTIDWVLKESQGDIASPPPHPPANIQKRAADAPTVAQLVSIPEPGPDGTVPIARSSRSDLPPKRLPKASDNNSTQGAHTFAANGYAGTHWYASSNQDVLNHGGGAKFSIFNAYLESDYDFSLLQLAVTVGNAPQPGGGTTGQTLEAGWMHYPFLQQGGPFLFTYFTTNGYTKSGDNLGGYNRLQKGWVQVDKDIFPGVHLSPLSVDGGAQYDLQLTYYLYQGNWWLYAVDRYIGYYPASLYSQGGVDASKTLTSHSDVILFYGEVVNSQDHLTTTDMGSGEFPDTGFGKSGYIRNIVYLDTNDKATDYNSQGHYVISDPNRYRMLDHWNSGSDWGSYAFLGGPGAGGVVGG